MDQLLNKNGYSLQGLRRVNVILGKNGCGKSTVLKRIEQAISGREEFGRVRYITPERGGRLQYEPNVERNIISNINWLSESRRVNQFIQFREQSMVQYRKLELLCLREIETTPSLRVNLDYTFRTTIDQINSLLDNVEIKREESDFKIYRKGTNQPLDPASVSSGESELISLGIECLSFEKECVPGKANFLMIDEPDVHLHPDLQTRFVKFLRKVVDTGKFQVLVATHSTAFLGAFHDYEDVTISFMSTEQKDFEFRQINAVYKKILPVFGAHPLSNVFNEAPVLLVEGEDDERIWQQVVRTSRARVKIFPCSVEGIDKLAEYENEVIRVIDAVYDDAKAYSLRDRDNGPEEIDDLPPLIRFRLSCRSAENLLLSDDVLHFLGTTWDMLKVGIEAWLKNNQTHLHFAVFQRFCNEGFPRKSFDLKEIRNDLMGIIANPKPWEVVVGQTIGNLVPPVSLDDHSLGNYLGTKLVRVLLNKTE